MAETERKSAAPQRDSKGRFVRGNRGGGRTPMPAEMRQAFRAAGPEALQVLLDIMRAKDGRPADRIRAAAEVLDRGYGKAPQFVAQEIRAGGATWDLSGMTDEQIMEMADDLEEAAAAELAETRAKAGRRKEKMT